MSEIRRAPDPADEPRREAHREAAAALRSVIERFVASQAPQDVLERAAEVFREVAGSLEGHPQGNLFQGFSESSTSGDPTAFFDHSPLIGRANPIAPPMRLEVVEGVVRGRAVFGSAYEGPPGHVHGGFVAAAFDEVLGMAQSMSGNPGMTGTLTVRYRRPTPLHAEIRFEGELDRVDGRKIFTVGRAFHGDELLAESEAVFISVDFRKLFELDQARRRGEGAPEEG